MIAFPFCKINIGLWIVSRREDGFHNIESCFYPIPWTDILEIVPSEQFRFQSSGIPIPGFPEDNTCVKAWKMLQGEYNIPAVSIHLHKVIPTGAGLGGGSSDGALTLKILNTIFSLNIKPQQFLALAERLGSDCPFFLQDAVAIGTGKGEILTSFDFSLKGKFIVLVKPDIHISTAKAFNDVAPLHRDSSLSALLQGPIDKWKASIVNDFEGPVFTQNPGIADIKKRLYEVGAFYASMSGSGASVFGLFEKRVTIPPEFASMSTFQAELL